MPKKVITRRQRKAAEAKRRFEMIDDTPLDVLQEAAKVTSEETAGAQPEDKAEQPEAGADAPEAAEQDKEQAKATVRIIVNDKTSKPEKVLDFVVEENSKKTKPGGGGGGGLPSLPSPQIEQGSFSKALTRRAAATITKIQKLSKAFNKKINYKQSATQVDKGSRTNVDDDFVGPTKDEEKPCNCDFCKVVLSQLLARKKRSKDKKGKNSRRLANSRRSESPEPLDDVVNCDDCRVQTHKQRFLQLMEMNQRERDIRRVNKIELPQAKKTVKPSKSETKTETKPSDNNDTKSQKSEVVPPTVAGVKSRTETQKSEDVPPTVAGAKTAKSPSFKTESKKVLMKPTSKAIPEAQVKPKSENKENFYKVMQQMAEEPIVKEMQVLWNTGYFLMTGTDAQLSDQLRAAQAKNVKIQKVVLLKKGVHDKAELQLEKLCQDREEILTKMRNKYTMLEPRREERQKKQRKYP